MKCYAFMICYACEKPIKEFAHRRCERCYKLELWKFSERKKRGKNKFPNLRAYLSWFDKMPTAQEPHKVVLTKTKPKKKPKKKNKLRLAEGILKKVLHEYIRLKASKNGYCQCYTCNKILPYKGTGRMHAGHFITSGQHPMTRYDLNNIRAQCLQCNYFGSGKQQIFRELLVLEIGAKKVESLEIRSKLHKTWDLFEIEAMTKHYKKELKKLEDKL